MCWLFTAVIYVFKAAFFFVWDGLKALFSPLRRRRPRHKDYGDEICLVTGATQGLGKLLALEFAKRYAVLVIWDIQEEKLREVADEIKEIGSKVYPYVCDCSSREDIYKVAARVKKEVGSVSVLVNNAGILSGQTIMESGDEAIEQTFKVNTLAHFWTVKAFLPWMLEYNYGYIVQVSSILAHTGIPRLGDYCASKAAALAFSEALRLELRGKKKTGISVTCVCPYHMDTTMFAGATTSFPSLFPALKAEYVVERILQAMEERQFIVNIPRLMYFLVFLKSFIPTRSLDAIMDLLGTNKALDNCNIAPHHVLKEAKVKSS